MRDGDGTLIAMAYMEAYNAWVAAQGEYIATKIEVNKMTLSAAEDVAYFGQYITDTHREMDQLGLEATYLYTRMKAVHDGIHTV